MGSQPERSGRRAGTRLNLRLAGAGLLIAVGAIHLDLYLTGYRSIPTIGWLFLLQVIAAFALATAVLAWGGPLPGAAGAAFALQPWAATCCRCGSACSASPRSAPRRGSRPG